jgi:hypothetical protein
MPRFLVAWHHEPVGSPRPKQEASFRSRAFSNFTFPSFSIHGIFQTSFFLILLKSPFYPGFHPEIRISGWKHLDFRTKLWPETLFESVDFIDLNRSSAKPSRGFPARGDSRHLCVLIRKDPFRMRTIRGILCLFDSGSGSTRFRLVWRHRILSIGEKPSPVSAHNL